MGWRATAIRNQSLKLKLKIKTNKMSKEEKQFTAVAVKL